MSRIRCTHEPQPNLLEKKTLSQLLQATLLNLKMNDSSLQQTPFVKQLAANGEKIPEAWPTY